MNFIRQCARIYEAMENSDYDTDQISQEPDSESSVLDEIMATMNDYDDSNPEHAKMAFDHIKYILDMYKKTGKLMTENSDDEFDDSGIDDPSVQRRIYGRTADDYDAEQEFKSQLDHSNDDEISRHEAELRDAYNKEHQNDPDFEPLEEGLLPNGYGTNAQKYTVTIEPRDHKGQFVTVSGIPAAGMSSLKSYVEWIVEKLHRPEQEWDEKFKQEASNIPPEDIKKFQSLPDSKYDFTFVVMAREDAIGTLKNANHVNENSEITDDCNNDANLGESALGISDFRKPDYKKVNEFIKSKFPGDDAQGQKMVEYFWRIVGGYNYNFWSEDLKKYLGAKEHLKLFKNKIGGDSPEFQDLEKICNAQWKKEYEELSREYDREPGHYYGD